MVLPMYVRSQAVLVITPDSSITTHLVFVKIPPTPSPLTCASDIWMKELKYDSDSDFLLDGVSNGFCITSKPDSFRSVLCDNYKSATDLSAHDRVEQQILSEISQGNYIVCNPRPTIVSSLGAIEKDNGKVRLIHDCNRSGLNSYADTSKFKYETVDKAVSLLPPNGYLAKVDLSNAYRSVPIHNECLPATGLQ